MSRQSLVWKDIYDHVSEILKPEGASPGKAFIMRLGNQALYEISSRIEGVVKSWDNSATGDLTLTGYTCPLPPDCLRPFRIEYDGSANSVRRAQPGDGFTDGWRDATGDPSRWDIEGHNIVLDSTPSNTTGKLVLRGMGTIPEFSEESGAENPLDYLMLPSQLAVADYILSECPVSFAVPSGDTDAAIRAAQAETQRRVDVRDRHRAKWASELDKICEDLAARTREQFRYDNGE